MSKRVPIEETDIFRLFEEVAGWAWAGFQKWNWQAQQTVGQQLVRAIDSVNANLVEGDGRYTPADGLRFFVMARASAREARLWVRRAIDRGLVDEPEGSEAIAKIDRASKELNLLITFRRSTLQDLRVREELAPYGEDESFNPPILQS